MPWGQHDDKFHRNRKVKPLRRTQRGLAALGLRSLLHSECLDDPQLDGVVQLDDLRSKLERDLCKDLLAAGLLDEHPEGYKLHDYEDYNPTPAGLSRAKAKSAKRSAEYRERQRHAVTDSDVTPASRRDENVTLTPTHTQPIPIPIPIPNPAPKTACTQAGKPAKRAANGTSPSSLVWAAYAEAYTARYGCAPTRNARVNGQLAHFVKRVPADDAPAIAATYVRSNNRRYVAAGHSVGCLLQDAEKLCTELTTGRQTTAHEAQATDRKSGRRGEYEEMFARLRAEDEAAGELDAN